MRFSGRLHTLNGNENLLPVRKSLKRLAEEQAVSGFFVYREYFDAHVAQQVYRVKRLRQTM
jgi:hypothetical protein